MSLSAYRYVPILGICMLKEVIAPLLVWDVANNSNVRLEPGSILASCSIHRNGDTPYMMTFYWSGRELTCPLFRFQPRTRSIDPQPEAIAS